MGMHVILTVKTELCFQVNRLDNSYTVNESDRENLKISVKVFLSAPRKEVIQEALENGITSVSEMHCEFVY